MQKKYWRRWGEKKNSYSHPNSRWYSQIVRKRPRTPRTHSKAGTTGVKISVENFKANRKGLNRRSHDFWSIEGDFIYRHHIEPRVHLHVPKEIFPTPLIFLTWRELLKQILTCCRKNVSAMIGMFMVIQFCQIRGQDLRSSRHEMRNFLHDTWGPGGAWQRSKQPPDQIICGLRFGLACCKQPKSKKSKNGLSRVKAWQCSKIVRDIYFIDLEDEEYKETIKNARKKLEVPMEAVVPCQMETRKRAWKLRETVVSEKTNPHKKTKYVCVVEAHESTR